MTTESISTRKETVLVVDDEPRVVRLVSEILKVASYHVIAASNGERGLEMLAVEQPDLVLLDVLLSPGPDGYADLPAYPRVLGRADHYADRQGPG